MQWIQIFVNIWSSDVISFCDFAFLELCEDLIRGAFSMELELSDGILLNKKFSKNEWYPAKLGFVSGHLSLFELKRLNMI